MVGSLLYCLDTAALVAVSFQNLLENTTKNGLPSPEYRTYLFVGAEQGQPGTACSVSVGELVVVHTGVVELVSAAVVTYSEGDIDTISNLDQCQDVIISYIPRYRSGWTCAQKREILCQDGTSTSAHPTALYILYV